MTDTYNQAGLTYDSAAVTYNGEDALTSVFPLVGVFVAFTDGPYVASPGWTEITEYVRGITTSRGRADDLQDFDAGTAQLVLDNRERRFDPFNTAGPYYLNLTPRRQIKIVAQAGGVNYDVFRGYIAGWPVTWSEAGYDSTVTIQAFDALGLMVNEIVPTDWVGIYTESLSPLNYWRCNDSQGSQNLQDFYSSSALVRSSGTRPYFFEQPALANGLLGGSAFVDSYVTSNPPAVPNVAYDFTLALWIQFSGSSGDFSSFTCDYGTIRVSMFLYQRDSGTNPQGSLVIRLDSVSFGHTYTITQQITSNVPRHLVVAVNAAAQTLQIWLDGFDVTGTRTASAFRFSGLSNRNITFFGATIQEISIHNRILAAAEVSNLYNFGSGRITETTSARMERLRATTDYPAALTSFTTSPVASVSEIGSGSGVIPEMQLTTDSEGGEFYATKSGVLTMTSRFDAFNAARSATSQATFTDSGTGLRYGPEVTIEYDADALKNDITVNFTGDGEIGVYSDAVIEAYGGAALTIETYLDSPAAAAALGDAKLGVYGALVPRVSPIEVSVNTAAADWQTILGLELLDRVTFKRTPATGPQFNREALVNGIEHQIEPGVWRTQLAFSMRYTSPLICDDDVLGTVDFNYCG